MIASISSLLATQAGSTAFISKQLCVQIKIFFLRSVGFKHYFGAMERFTCFQRWHFIASDKVHLHGRNSESDFLCVHSTIFVVLFPLFPYEIFSPWNPVPFSSQCTDAKAEAGGRIIIVRHQQNCSDCTFLGVFFFFPASPKKQSMLSSAKSVEL